MVQLNQDGLKLKGTHQLLVYADDANKFGRSVHTIMKTREGVVVVSKETELEANVDKTKYMVMSRDQNAGRSQNKMNDYNSLEGWNSSNIREKP
jgi:hypothetical protein